MRGHPFTKKGQRTLQESHKTVKGEYKRLKTLVQGDEKAFLINNGIICPIEDQDSFTLILHGPLAESVYAHIKKEVSR